MALTEAQELSIRDRLTKWGLNVCRCRREQLSICGPARLTGTSDGVATELPPTIWTLCRICGRVEFFSLHVLLRPLTSVDET